ncbi:MAG: exodeoxyribonuclease VII small subunit [Alphaproteobacteria bacterium]|nr:exodeoxyribonuclease VII small subunit [Alphaproteobacteria bacterium]
MSDPDIPFEEALAQLEDKVRTLEGGEVPLDEALRLFEDGVKLARTCHAHLDAAEQRVAVLTRGAEGVDEAPLE